jgi:hypothetical protein
MSDDHDPRVTPMCPECAQGKCGNCTTMALHPQTDALVPCGCPHPGVPQ